MPRLEQEITCGAGRQVFLKTGCLKNIFDVRASGFSKSSRTSCDTDIKTCKVSMSSLPHFLSVHSPILSMSFGWNSWPIDYAARIDSPAFWGSNTHYSG